MYICICNAIKERDIKKVLEQDTEGNSTVSGVYHACSDGEKPQCCTCLQTLKDMVSDHRQRCCGEKAAAQSAA